MVKHRALAWAVVVAVALSAPTLWSQDTNKDKDAKQEQAPSVAPATVEITPNPLDVHVGEKVKFSAVAKDASGNPIDVKPSVWFAAPFDLAGANDNGEVTFHMPGVVTVGAVIAGKAGYATVNVTDSKVTAVEIEPPAYPSLVAGGAEKLTATTHAAN